MHLCRCGSVCAECMLLYVCVVSTNAGVCVHVCMGFTACTRGVYMELVHMHGCMCTPMDTGLCVWVCACVLYRCIWVLGVSCVHTCMGVCAQAWASLGCMHVRGCAGEHYMGAGMRAVEVYPSTYVCKACTQCCVCGMHVYVCRCLLVSVLSGHGGVFG